MTQVLQTKLEHSKMLNYKSQMGPTTSEWSLQLKLCGRKKSGFCRDSAVAGTAALPSC